MNCNTKKTFLYLFFQASLLIVIKRKLTLLFTIDFLNILLCFLVHYTGTHDICYIILWSHPQTMWTDFLDSLSPSWTLFLNKAYVLSTYYSSHLTESLSPLKLSTWFMDSPYLSLRRLRRTIVTLQFCQPC